jgi:hypothetical protein
MDPLLGNEGETNNTVAIARQQLRKYATVLEPFLCSGPYTTMEILLEAVFSMDPLRSYITLPTELRQLVQCSVVELVLWSEVNWLVT